MSRVSQVVTMFAVCLSVLIVVGCEEGTAFNSGAGPTQYKLRAFAAGSSLSGSFFLGCGQIGSAPAFSFLWEKSNGATHLYKVPARYCTIFTDQPSGQGYVIARRSGWKWGAPTEGYGCAWGQDGLLFELHIPKDAIMPVFELDVSDTF